MKIARKVGSTSQILQIFVRDSSSTTGGGLTGLVFNTASLTAYYHRDTDTTATAITLVTMTVGTFTSSGFKEVDATNMPGVYQFCPPNACFNTGTSSVFIYLKGATNMAPLPLEIDLDAQVDVTHIAGTASVGTAGYVGVDWAQVTNKTTSNALTGTTIATTQKVDVDTIKTNPVVNGGTITFPTTATLASTTNITAGTITTVTTTTTATNLTNAPTAGDFTAAMKTSLNASTPAAITGAVASVTDVNSIADGLLDRNMATGTDSGGRTVRNALRILRNKFSTSGTTLTVTKEDDTTAAWTSTLTTDAAAVPITGSDPA